MPITKTTDTVSGVDNVALLSLTQYGIRAKIEIPNKKAIAATHRSSSGTNRTITLAEDHGMSVNDLFLFGGFANTNYNPTPSSYLIGNVSANPAANKLTYIMGTALTEAETPDPGGGIVRLGFRTLRIGMRSAAPRTTAWASEKWSHGMGLAQGEYPVGSPNCVSFFGCGGDDAPATSAHPYTAGPPSCTTTPFSNTYLCFVKRSGTWAGTTTSGLWRTAASRSQPFIRLMDLTVNALTSLTPSFSIAELQFANQTRDLLLTTLRNPLPLSSGVFAGYTVGTFYTNTSTHWAHYNYGADLYLEAFIRDPAQSLEIMDIGYSYFS